MFINSAVKTRQPQPVIEKIYSRLTTVHTVTRNIIGRSFYVCQFPICNVAATKKLHQEPVMLNYGQKHITVQYDASVCVSMAVFLIQVYYIFALWFVYHSKCKCVYCYMCYCYL